MADNVTVDNGGLTDYVTSTEEVTTLNGGAASAQHIQRMLLAFRTSDGVANDLPGDTTNGLDVDVTRVQGTVNVADGGGSLTVDGSVTADTELPAAAALADAAGNPTTPTIGSGNLVWNGTGWDRARGDITNGIDVDVTRLPALPAGTNNIGDVDVLTLPALAAGTAEIGKVQISDGTDVATVLPVRSQPATTEKALNIIELPSRLPTYAVATAEVAPAITIGVKEGLCLWHASTQTKDIYIVELWAAFIVTTASTTGGRTTVRVSTVTAAPTGGTEETVADLGGAGASTEMSNRMRVKTGGGTIGATFIRRGVEYATQPLGNQIIPLFSASTVGNGIILRAGSGQGISIDVERVVAHTALVDQWTFGARWIEL